MVGLGSVMCRKIDVGAVRGKGGDVRVVGRIGLSNIRQGLVSGVDHGSSVVGALHLRHAMELPKEYRSMDTQPEN